MQIIKQGPRSRKVLVEGKDHEVATWNSFDQVVIDLETYEGARRKTFYRVQMTLEEARRLGERLAQLTDHARGEMRAIDEMNASQS